MILFLGCVYLAASLQEWFFHKFLMHHPLPWRGFHGLYVKHQFHHSQSKGTDGDYSVRDNPFNYICFDVLSMDGIVQTALVFSINTGFFYMLFPSLSLWTLATPVAIMLAINIGFWNTIHPLVHGLDPVATCFPPGLPLSKENIWIQWWIDNHQRHHDNHQRHHDNPQCNFNIVFPGADYLLGTRPRSPPHDLYKGHRDDKSSRFIHSPKGREFQEQNPWVDFTQPVVPQQFIQGESYLLVNVLYIIHLDDEEKSRLEFDFQKVVLEDTRYDSKNTRYIFRREFNGETIEIFKNQILVGDHLLYRYTDDLPPCK